MTGTKTAGERITEQVTAWPGVTAGPGARGAFSLTLGRRELGHLHGDRVPRAVWRELFDAGRIEYHPVFPGKPGYAARGLASEADALDAIELLRLNYDRIVAAHGLPVAS